MTEIRGPDMKEQAREDYLKGMKYKDIAEKYEVSINTVKSWKQRYNWNRKGVHTKKKSVHTKKGAPKGNKNAIGNSGGSAPKGNLNAVKHGAYQSMYTNFLSDEEKAIYEQISATVNIDEEIRLLRLKIARLLNREQTFFYDVFGKRHVKEVSEEDRENGILACMDQLRKLIESKAKITTDTEQLGLDKEKFEFQKYKTEVELQLKKDKLELEKENAGNNKHDKPIEIMIKRKGED